MLIDLVSFVRLCLMQLKKQTPNSDTNIYLPQVCVYLQATVTQLFWSPTSLLGYPWATEHARSIWYGQNCALLPLSSVSMHLLPPVHPPQGCQTLYSIMQICLGSLHGQNPPITYRIKSKLQRMKVCRNASASLPPASSATTMHLTVSSLPECLISAPYRSTSSPLCPTPKATPPLLVAVATPLSMSHPPQDLEWMPETEDSTKPYRDYVFSHTYIPMIKSNI